MAAKPVILAVDDDADVLRLIKSDLRKQYGHDYRVLSADGGQAALDALLELQKRGEPVALLVVDQRMPGMGGVDFLEQAIKLFPTCKRILLTAYADTEAAIKAILAEVGEEIPVQLGGGIRDLDTIERYLDDGLSFIIIGTAAVKNPGFLRDACSAFGGHIIVGLDAKDGKVATDGWSKLTGHEVVDLAKKFQDYGVEGVIYTDIGRDGMLSGINIEATVKLAQALTIRVIASGGLSNLADIDQLCAVEDQGVEGVICGRAIYTGDLDFAAAQARADELNGA